MSNALGIAAVTHVLKDLLNDGLINQNVTDVLGTPVHVSSIPPGELSPVNGSIPTQINLFLYRVSYNTGWNNRNYPVRDSDGNVIRSTPLSLDLHYMLTAFGERELHAEILLGYGMQIFHEHTVLQRDAIRSSLTPASVSDPSGRLPANLNHLATSGLADQVEMIKIVPESLTTEDISKLWSAFQTRYRTCTGYMVSVVLIDVDKPSHPALPVQTRKIYTLLFRYPRITRIRSHAVAADPLSEFRKIIIGDRLVIEGQQLKSDSLVVRISESDVFPVAADIRDTSIAIVLTPALGLKAGTQGIQVIQNVTVGDSPNDHTSKWASSNLHAFVLNPDLTLITPNVNPVGGGLHDGTIQVQLTPDVQPRQRVVLFLDQINPPPGNDALTYSFVLPSTLPAAATNTLTFSVAGIETGMYLVRVQVDGADSPLGMNALGEYDFPSIPIP